MQAMNPRPIGRPRTFDDDTAVLAAARLFWRHGYSGTSTRALSSALGLSTSSIYAAFGSKAGLFERAVRTYAEAYREIYRKACAEPRLTDVLERLFQLSIEEFTQPSSAHPGCLISSAVMTDMPDTIDTRSYVADLHASNERLLLARINRARQQERIAPDVASAALTGLIQAIWHGLSTQSNQGANRAQLLEISDMARKAIQHRLTPTTP